VAELVETGREDSNGENEQQQAGVGEGVVSGGRQPLDHENPPARGHEGCCHCRHDQRMEEHSEGRRQLPRPFRVGDRVAEAHPQQRVSLPDARLGTIGKPEQPQRQQLALDQRLNIVGADQFPEAETRVFCDFCGVPLAVDGLQYEEQQIGQLDGLAIGAADQERRFPVAGAFGLADQLDAVCAHGNPALMGIDGGRGGNRRAVRIGRPAGRNTHRGFTVLGRTAGPQWQLLNHRCSG
jgi:hypothetical protein